MRAAEEPHLLLCFCVELALQRAFALDQLRVNALPDVCAGFSQCFEQSAGAGTLAGLQGGRRRDLPRGLVCASASAGRCRTRRNSGRWRSRQSGVLDRCRLARKFSVMASADSIRVRASERLPRSRSMNASLRRVEASPPLSLISRLIASACSK